MVFKLFFLLVQCCYDAVNKAVWEKMNSDLRPVSHMSHVRTKLQAARLECEKCCGVTGILTASAISFLVAPMTWNAAWWMKCFAHDDDRNRRGNIRPPVCDGGDRHEQGWEESSGNTIRVSRNELCQHLAQMVASISDCLNHSYKTAFLTFSRAVHLFGKLRQKSLNFFMTDKYILKLYLTRLV